MNESRQPVSPMSQVCKLLPLLVSLTDSILQLSQIPYQSPSTRIRNYCYPAPACEPHSVCRNRQGPITPFPRLLLPPSIYSTTYGYEDTTGLIDSSYIFLRTYPSPSQTLNFYSFAGMYHLPTLGYHK